MPASRRSARRFSTSCRQRTWWRSARCSEKALLYTEDDFPHKILSMGEAAGAEEQSLQDYLLRELIGEGKLHYPVVQKIGNELVTITVEKNGPVCFLVTTTKAALNPENETRMLSLEIDDSGEQTTVVIDKLAETIGLNAESTVINYEPWRDFQRWLADGNCAVVVPFARELGQLIPPRSVKSAATSRKSCLPSRRMLSSTAPAGSLMSAGRSMPILSKTTARWPS